MTPEQCSLNPICSCSGHVCEKCLLLLAQTTCFLLFPDFFVGNIVICYQGEVDGSKLHQQLFRKAQKQFSEQFATENRSVCLSLV